MQRLCLILTVFISFQPVLAKNKLIRGPYLQAATDDSITIRWRTEDPSPTFVKYKAYGDKDNKQYQDLVQTTEHQAKLIGLKPQTKYFYTLYSQEKKDQILLGEDRLKSFFFNTKPDRDKTDYTSYVWVLGDPGTNGTKKYDYSDKKSQLKVRDAFYDYHAAQKLPAPSLILTLGDNAYPYASDEDLQRAIFEPYQEILSYVPIFPVFGNHDAGYNKKHKTYTARSYPQPHGSYFDTFSFPETGKAYYSFNDAQVHFIVLDSYDSYWEDLKADRSNLGKAWTSKSTAQNSMIEWLKQDLAINKNADWTIVAYHHPAYATNDDDINEGVWQDWMKTNIVPLLEKHKVDLVLNGHVHNYQRSYQLADFKVVSKNKDKYQKGLGTIYTILGCSGQSYKEADTSELIYQAFAKEGSILLKINPKELDLKFISIDGTILDKFKIVKN
ncbi:MAG: metallophosphoesterase family protein [Cyanobacteria bacterium]|nr:metallophosphoesterase family protein [Cyanobacteriota bacterium]MDA1020863.1 metallophosphoesterase family protein [Cyanobacteriota bacterium]